MVDGTYEVTARIPFRTVRGTVTLESEGHSCTGTLSFEGGIERASGFVQGNAFSFLGSVRTPIGPIEYEVTGTADGSTISATAATRMGKVKIAGTRA